MSGKYIIDISKPFTKYADKIAKAITSFHLPAEDVLIEPDDIKDSPRIKNKFQIHMVKRFFDEWNNVH